MAVTTIRGGRQITDSTIPYADIQNVTANTVLANNTASATSIQEVALSTNTLLGRGSTGNIAAISVGTGLSFSGTTLNATVGIGGSTGSVDNAILRADGTGGVTLQNSAVTIDDSGNLTVGTTSIAGSTRSFTAEGSAANIDFRIVPKGTGRAYLYSSDLQSYVYASNSAIVLSSTNTSASLEIAINGASSTQSRFTFSGGSLFTLQRITTDTASVSNTLRILQYSTGTPAAGFGSSIDFVLPVSSGVTEILSNLIVDIQTLGTNGLADFSVKLRDTGGTNVEKFRVKGTGQIRFNTYTSSSSFTGTAAGYLAFDSSGNILTVAVPGGGVSDGDKGDITVSGSGATWTIDNAAVTYAKIQNVAANTFLANATGSAATVQEVATTRIPLFSSAITGTPSASTYLRGDGSWATISASGITTLNTLTAATQTFATGTSGTDFAISSSTSTHTFNIPDAGASARGLVTTGTQTLAGQKTFSSAINLTSGQIIFPASQSASADANTLDDYEEGNWTPAFTSSSGSFTTLTYNAAAGKYQKIGHKVFISGRIATNSVTIGTATGDLRISGLPFSSGSATGPEASMIYCSYVLTWASEPPTGGLAGTTSTITLYRERDTTTAESVALGPTDLTTGAVTNANIAYFFGFYTV